MEGDFLAGLLGNPSRARVLRAFVFDQSAPLTLVQVAKRAAASTNTTMKEIRALEKLGIIKKGRFTITLKGSKREVSGKGGSEAWVLDNRLGHVLALSRFVHEVTPAQHKAIVEALKHSGKLATIILSGNFLGDPTRPADLIVAADVLNEKRLETAVRALEPRLGREIRYAAFTTPELRYRLTVEDRLIRDTLDYPHIVLLDKAHLL